MVILVECFLSEKNIKSEKLVDVTFNSMWEGIKKLNQEIH